MSPAAQFGPREITQLHGATTSREPKWRRPPRYGEGKGYEENVSSHRGISGKELIRALAASLTLTVARGNRFIGKDRADGIKLVKGLGVVVG
ncbi:hypothetical protein N7448_006937 [Penicillium atrosanguineum]|uniref:Uncharacterized protein n=1 Tax=Penicillium atrosanguineum TaxID=1132637 RepID=A0A9W9GZ91_9EURO|nr:uncharacterized protein N7443_010698 [Penicillium atrosanguineum]KAJ5132779.1 hypothetical protein N7448_006937 [Penicillium atrosanguineum]KAJ5141332.1 hypothetical protein N7526_002327 [Penicillium atrosanguineum]KAJ5290445.1 hypothetical protein N7443_010698 [Penicillium atrosanguineum]KAJ5308267.1 hypothetical protein N7476_008923 [Penicillium atrosanguineum]